MRVFDTRKIIDAGDMSGDITSNVLDMGHLKSCSMDVSWSNGTGVIKIQGSNSNVDADFKNLDEINNEIVNPAGSAGSLLLNLNEIAFRYIRLFYDRTSGTGTMNVIAHGKEK